jgi:hypothetical protein
LPLVLFPRSTPQAAAACCCAGDSTAALELELPFPDAAPGEKPGEFPDPPHAAAMPAIAMAAVHKMNLFIHITFFCGSLWPRCEALARESDDLIQSIDSTN